VTFLQEYLEQESECCVRVIERREERDSSEKETAEFPVLHLLLMTFRLEFLDHSSEEEN